MKEHEKHLTLPLYYKPHKGGKKKKKQKKQKKTKKTKKIVSKQ
jgi:hypothetical protein